MKPQNLSLIIGDRERKWKEDQEQNSDVRKVGKKKSETMTRVNASRRCNCKRENLHNTQDLTRYKHCNCSFPYFYQGGVVFDIINTEHTMYNMQDAYNLATYPDLKTRNICYNSL